MEQDRRRSPRYPFVGSIEMREGSSEDKRTARVKELSMNGCYVDMESPYPMGASLVIKLFTETEFFEAQASVIYSRPDHGMGLMFRETIARSRQFSWRAARVRESRGPRRIWDVFRLSRPPRAASYSRLGRLPSICLIRHIRERTGNKMLVQAVPAHEWL